MTLVFVVDLIYAPLMFFFYLDYTTAPSVGNLDVLATVKLFCIVDMAMRFFTGYWDNSQFVVSSATFLFNLIWQI